MEIDIEKISPDKDQPRKSFEGITELAETIRKKGMINPIVVDKNFKILCGERRYRAATNSGWTGKLRKWSRKMSKSLPKKQICKFAKENKIYDVVIYGSTVKGGEPRDLDILLIFIDRKLEERAEIAQKLRLITNADVKTINIEELFEKNFIARTGAYEGYSLLSNEPFSEKLGFKCYSLFSYNLKKLDHNEKTQFTYALIGRDSAGVIEKLNIRRIGSGALLVPIKNSLPFEAFLKKWDINYEKHTVLYS